MTRETKAGLVVTCSFLCLVGMVFFTKMKEQHAAAEGTARTASVPEVPADPTPVAQGEPVAPSLPPPEPNADLAVPAPKPPAASGEAAPVPPLPQPGQDLQPVTPPPLETPPARPTQQEIKLTGADAKPAADTKKRGDLLAQLEDDNGTPPPAPAVGEKAGATPANPSPTLGDNTAVPPPSPPGLAFGEKTPATATSPPAPMPPATPTEKPSGPAISEPMVPPAPPQVNDTPMNKVTIPAPPPSAFELGAETAVPGETKPEKKEDEENSGKKNHPRFAKVVEGAKALLHRDKSKAERADKNAQVKLQPKEPEEPPAIPSTYNGKAQTGLGLSLETNVKTETKPKAPSRPMPPLGTPPALVGTAPVRLTQADPPRAPLTTPSVDSYEEEKYICQPGDTLASISRLKCASEKYAQALVLFNRDHPQAAEGLLREPPALQPGQALYIPPVSVLEKYRSDARPDASPSYQSAVSLAAPRPVNANQGASQNADAPASAMPSGNSWSGTTGARSYRVRANGEMIYEIARRTLGSGERWYEIYRLNSRIRPEILIPAGEILRLPQDARIDAEDAP